MKTRTTTEMSRNGLHNQELVSYEEMTDSNAERNQRLNLNEKRRGIQAANQNSSGARIVNIIYFLYALLILLLVVRIILQLMGANAENGFANFVYGLSAPFVRFFATLLQNPSLGGTSVLEITTIIAIFVYAIGAWATGRLAWLVLSRPR